MTTQSMTSNTTSFASQNPVVNAFASLKAIQNDLNPRAAAVRDEQRARVREAVTTGIFSRA